MQYDLPMSGTMTLAIGTEALAMKIGNLILQV
jgi:hypothetical protein